MDIPLGNGDETSTLLDALPLLLTYVAAAFKVSFGVVIVVSIANLIWCEIKRQQILKFFREQGVAEPKAHSLLGILKERLDPANKYRPLDFFIDKLDEIPNARCYLMKGMVFDSEVNVWTRDPEIVKYMLVDGFQKWTKPPPDQNLFFALFGEWLGDGIFVAQHGDTAPDKGESWYVQRKTASLMFTRNTFRSVMMKTFVEKGHELCKVIAKGEGETAAPKEVLEKAGVPNAKVLDFQSLMFRFSMDSVLGLFFGAKSDTLNGIMDPYARAFDTAQVHLIKFFINNIKSFVMAKSLVYPIGSVGGMIESIVKFLSPDYRIYRNCIDTMNEYSRKIIEERGKPILKKLEQQQSNDGNDIDEDDENVDADNMLSFFIHAAYNEKRPILQKLKHNEEAKIQFLSDVVLSLVLAGRDTTASALSWTLFELSRNPDIQRELQKEIDAKLPDKADPTYEDVHGADMPYLNGVFYETLRLHPPVPNDSKDCTVDDVLPDGTKVPKGTRLNFFIYGMGRDKKIWGDDALEFNPTRWIPFKIPPGGIWPVFQLGPRRCLGEQMAIMEAKVALIMILQRFNLKLLPGEEEKICPSSNITMSLCNSKTCDSYNLWLITEPRE